jgi:hypothetical protein
LVFGLAIDKNCWRSVAGRKMVRSGVPFSRVAGVVNWNSVLVGFAATGVVAVEDGRKTGSGGGGDGL